MDRDIGYQINLKEFKKTFRFAENKVYHKTAKCFKLLPFVPNESKLVLEFIGVTGEFSRMISQKKIEEKFEPDLFIKRVVKQIEVFEGEGGEDELKEEFKNLIKKMFLDEKNGIVFFDIKTLNYIYADSSEERIANFLYTILFSGDLNTLISEKYNKKVDNIIYKIVLQALPQLKDKSYNHKGYFCYLPIIRDLFLEDFKFLLSNEELYKASLRRLLEYYYFFYISQLSIKLEQLEKADLTKIEPIYFMLDWEKTSKNRRGYEYGLEKVKPFLESLFSHAVVLEMLNHCEGEAQLGYHGIAEKLVNENDNNILELIHVYLDQLHLQDKKDYKDKIKISLEKVDNEGFKVVRTLLKVVKYQFENSSRSRASKAYENWFLKFTAKSFAKRRGRLSYCLNLTEDDVILMTKLCIKDKGKVKLKSLFEEFEKRGIYLDKYSKEKVIQLYEKLNILEKKSDSGDAQYVKAIL